MPWNQFPQHFEFTERDIANCYHLVFSQFCASFRARNVEEYISLMQESRKDEAREYKSKNTTTRMNRPKNESGVSQKESVNSLRSGVISSSSIDSFNLDGHYEGLLKFLLFARVNDNIGYLLTENNLISLPSASLQMSRTLFGSRDKLNAAAPIHHSVDDIYKVSVKAEHRVMSFLQITDDEITAEGFSLNGLKKCGGKSESFLGLKNQFRKFLGLPAYRTQEKRLKFLKK